MRTKSRELLTSCKDAAAALGELCASFTGKIASTTDRLLDRFPQNKKRPMLFAIGAAALLFIILLIAALALNSQGPRQSAIAGIGITLNIPPEELFIPDEPDFIPDFLLERESRNSWSIEDIRPYWRNPGNWELWRREIQSAVDSLMESVP